MRGQLLLELEERRRVFLVGRMGEHGWMYLWTSGTWGQAWSTDIVSCVSKFDDEETAAKWAADMGNGAVVVPFDPNAQRQCHDCRRVMGVEDAVFAEDLPGNMRTYCTDCRKTNLVHESAWLAKRAARAQRIEERRST